MAGNLANLQKATAARTAGALARAETALNAMLKDGEPITFRGLAARAGVSLDFLYRNTPIRARVEHLRDRQRTEAAPRVQPEPDAGQPSNVIRALTAQLAEARRRHREETTALRQALEAAHGENLLLRRSIGSHAGPGNPA